MQQNEHTVSINSLPYEILSQILHHVVSPSTEPESYFEQRAKFARLLTVSKHFYLAAVPALYRHASFSHPHSFAKFLASIEQTGYGRLVRAVDFSSFTSVGLGRTARMNQEIQMVTSSSILKMLTLCPTLVEFTACESIEDDISAAVIDHLLQSRVEALDFCGCTSARFREAVLGSGLVAGDYPLPFLKRLGLHGCATLPAVALDIALRKLTGVTHLDLTHTLASGRELLNLASSAPLQRLSLAKCVRLDSYAVLTFFSRHPAARHLEWVSLMVEASKPSPIARDDLRIIYKYLQGLAHIDLCGQPVSASDLPYFASPYLKSLSVAYSDLPVLDLMACVSRSHNLAHLDVSGNPSIDMWSLPDLLNCSASLRTVELSGDRIASFERNACRSWRVVKTGGSRSFIVRDDSAGAVDAPASFANGQLMTPPASPEAKPAAFSFSKFAQERIERSRSRSRSPDASSFSTQLSSQPRFCAADFGHASRKIAVNTIGLGGFTTRGAAAERGLYLYYAFRK